MRIILIIILLFIPFISYCEELLVEPAWVYKGRGDVFLKEGDIGNAIAQYKKAILKKKELNDNNNQIGYPEVYLNLAKIYKKDGLYDLALSYIEMAEDQKNDFEISELEYDLLYTKADIYMKKDDISKAIDVYKDIIKDDSNWNNNNTKIIRENPDKFKINNELIKKFGESYFILGKIKYENNNFENAILYLDMARYYKYKLDITIEYLINCYEKTGNSLMIRKLKNIHR